MAGLKYGNGTRWGRTGQQHKVTAATVSGRARKDEVMVRHKKEMEREGRVMIMAKGTRRARDMEDINRELTFLSRSVGHKLIIVSTCVYRIIDRTVIILCHCSVIA